MIFILSDEINSGKSTIIGQMVDEALSVSKSVSGFFTPAHMDNNKKIGHDIVFIEDGKKSNPAPFTRELEFENSTKWRRFYFSDDAIKTAKALNVAANLFIIDEIGPLELAEKRGFYELFSGACRTSKNLLCVVRKSSLSDALNFITKEKSAVFSLNESKELIEQILNILTNS